MKYLQNNLLLTRLSVIEFFICFAFFGTLNILVLHLTGMGFTDKAAYSVWLNYEVVIYIFSLIGGIVGNRFVSYRIAGLLGLILITLGFLSLGVLHGKNLLVINAGLALVACGNGLFGPNIRNLLGASYVKKHQRYNGFTFYHVANILGQIAGPALLTYLSQFNQAWLFSAAGISVLLALLVFIYSYHVFVNPTIKPIPPLRTNSLSGTGVVIGMIILSLVLMNMNQIGYLLGLLGVGVTLAVLMILAKSSITDRVRILSIVWLMLGFLAASTCFRQAISIFNLFTEQYVDRVLGTWTIPAGMYISLEPVFVLFLAPLYLFIWQMLDKRNSKVSAGTAFSIGLTFLAMSFACLALGTAVATHGKVAMSWLILNYFVMACGELLILPIGVAAVTELSPERWKGLLMGCWLLMISFSSYINGVIGKLISPLTGSPSLATYQTLFTTMTGFSLGSATLLYIIWQLWQRKYGHYLPQE